MDLLAPARCCIVRGANRRSAPRAWSRALIVAACLVTLAGCAGPQWVAVRQTPHNPLTERLMLLSSGGPRPTQRTLTFLRKYDLESQVHENPVKLVQQIQAVIDREPSAEALSAAAELAYIGGVKSQ